MNYAEEEFKPDLTLSGSFNFILGFYFAKIDGKYDIISMSHTYESYLIWSLLIYDADNHFFSFLFIFSIFFLLPDWLI